MHAGTGEPDVRVDPSRVGAVMLMVVAVLTALHLAALRLAFGGGDTLDPQYAGYLLLDADHEVSLPTWWQQSVLLVAAGLALVLAREARRSGRRYVRHWRVLSVVLVVASIDEGTQIHERFTTPMRDGLGVDGGLLYYAWIVPASALLLLFTASYGRFWLALPALPRLLSAVAGAAYILGGIGVESLGGAHEAKHGMDYGFVVLTAIEEGLEMIGQALLVWTFLLLLTQRTGGRLLTVGPAVEVESARDGLAVR